MPFDDDMDLIVSHENWEMLRAKLDELSSTSEHYRWEIHDCYEARFERLIFWSEKGVNSSNVWCKKKQRWAGGWKYPAFEIIMFNCTGETCFENCDGR